ncbi:MAG: hypothetical protein Q4G18_10905, partial [Myroides sp.]|nr:hypothetical protein [Myroides sp.]
MFSFQFGTFESSTPGWLEWLNIAASFLGVVFSVGAAYLIFKSEQNTKDKEEVNLNEEHFNSLNDIAKIQLPLYEKQILNIDSYLNNLDDNLLLEVVVGLYNDYAKNFDLIRLVKHSKLKKLNTEEFYQFYNSIYYTSNVIDKMENEMLRYFEKSNILDDKIKS